MTAHLASSGRSVAEALPAVRNEPARPLLPVRVPVTGDCGGDLIRADVVSSTANVLLLQGAEGSRLPALGIPIRLRVTWDRQVITGRIAAHGLGGRFLVSIGERPIRRSRRYPVDLVGTAVSALLPRPFTVHIADLSTGGARVEMLDLPVGSDVSLRFTRPGTAEPIDVLGFVVRTVEGATVPTVGIAFRVGQPSLDALARPSA
jgi:hypothetical protein